MHLRDEINALVYFCKHDVDDFIKNTKDTERLRLLWRALAAWPTSITAEALPTVELILDVFEFVAAGFVDPPLRGIGLNLSSDVPTEEQREKQREQVERDLKASGNDVPNTVSGARERIRDAIRSRPRSGGRAKQDERR